MYICDENVLANELDFKKALDLLRYVEDAHERESRRSRIWAKAILRDAWTTFDTDNVLSSVSSTVFFKIVEFSLSTGNGRKKRSRGGRPTFDGAILHAAICSRAPLARDFFIPLSLSFLRGLRLSISCLAAQARTWPTCCPTRKKSCRSRC